MLRSQIVGVERVEDLTEAPFAYRELMLVKVRCNAAQRREVKDIADIFRGHIVDLTLSTVTIELTGRESKVRMT